MCRLLFFLAFIAGLPAPARADYFTDQQNELLRQIEHAFNAYVRGTWFDGTKIAAEAPSANVSSSVRKCNDAVAKFDQVFPTVDAKIRAGDRARKLQQRYTELVPHCRALKSAAEAYAREAQARAARAEADRQAAAAATKAEADKAAAKTDADRKALGERRAAIGEWFRKIEPYTATIQALTTSYDPKFRPRAQTSYTDSPQLIAKYKADIAEVHKVCVATPPPPPSGDHVEPHDLLAQQIEICKMAALGGDALVKRAKRRIAINVADLNTKRLLRDIQSIIDGQEPAVNDDIQKLVFDYDAWLAGMVAFYKPKFDEIDETVPADLFAAVVAIAPTLRAKIDEHARTRTFPAQPFRDAQVEALVKKKLPGTFKGAKLVKIGLSYSAWQAFDERTWVKSDANYDYYRVNQGKNRYKRGWILVQLAGHPHCQAREFIVRRVKNGPIEIDSFDGGGTFMKCE